MVATREQALEIAPSARAGLEAIYGPNLAGVYPYGSAARDRLRQDSDIDIAGALHDLADRFTEHMRVSDLRAALSLESDTLVRFLMVPAADLARARFAVHRAIQDEGIPA